MKKGIVCMLMMTFLAVAGFAQTPLVDRIIEQARAMSEEEWEQYHIYDNMPSIIALVDSATTEEINMRSARNPETGDTALSYVLRISDGRLVQTLLDKGADVTMHVGYTALDGTVYDWSLLEKALSCSFPQKNFVKLLNAGSLEEDIVNAARKEEWAYNVAKKWAEQNNKTDLLARLSPIGESYQRAHEVQAAKNEIVKKFGRFIEELNPEEISQDTIYYKFPNPAR